MWDVSKREEGRITPSSFWPEPLEGCSYNL